MRGAIKINCPQCGSENLESEECMAISINPRPRRMPYLCVCQVCSCEFQWASGKNPYSILYPQEDEPVVVELDFNPILKRDYEKIGLIN